MYIELTPKHWAYAALIGEARRRSNNNKRNKNRDRGFEKNIQNDLIGSIGELICMEYFQNWLSEANKEELRKNVFGIGGGTGFTGTDINLDLHEKKLKLDIKTFDCEPNKKYFAINNKKHEKLKGNCDGYVCLLIPKYGRAAYLLPMIRHDEVDQWEIKELGRYGDPSRNKKIHDLVRETTNDSKLISNLMAYNKYSREDISNAIWDKSNLGSFKNLCPDAFNFLNIKTKH